jgi:hypothetical protein
MKGGDLVKAADGGEPSLGLAAPPLPRIRETRAVVRASEPAPCSPLSAAAMPSHKNVRHAAPLRAGSRVSSRRVRPRRGVPDSPPGTRKSNKPAGQGGVVVVAASGWCSARASKIARF